MKIRIAVIAIPLLFTATAKLAHATNDTITINDPVNSPPPETFSVTQGTGQTLTAFYGPLLDAPDQWILIQDPGPDGHDSRLIIIDGTGVNSTSGFYYLESDPLLPITSDPLFTGNPALPDAPNTVLDGSTAAQEVNSFWVDTDDFTFPVTLDSTPPSPEPASLSLLGLGATALLTRRRKS